MARTYSLPAREGAMGIAGGADDEAVEKAVAGASANQKLTESRAALFPESPADPTSTWFDLRQAHAANHWHIGSAMRSRAAYFQREADAAEAISQPTQRAELLRRRDRAQAEGQEILRSDLGGARRRCHSRCDTGPSRRTSRIPTVSRQPNGR